MYREVTIDNFGVSPPPYVRLVVVLFLKNRAAWPRNRKKAKWQEPSWETCRGCAQAMDRQSVQNTPRS